MKLAIVGNGKLSQNYGKDIDSCDLVIRFNKAKTKGYEQLVGTKTSILALVGETSLSYNQAVDKLDKSIVRDIEYIYISGRKRNEDYEKAILKLKGHGNIIFQYINYDYFKAMCTLIDIKTNKNPSTGINILCYMIATHMNLNDGDNEFNIYGFDNFKSGHYFDDENRNNSGFHDLDIERQILDYLNEFKNINMYI